MASERSSFGVESGVEFAMLLLPCANTTTVPFDVFVWLVRVHVNCPRHVDAFETGIHATATADRTRLIDTESVLQLKYGQQRKTINAEQNRKNPEY
jgi:hypothetical protein